MWGYFLRRLSITIPTILIAVSVVYIMLRFTPGGPFDSERGLPDNVKANIYAKYNLDKPPLTQYYLYMKDFLMGDFGVSFRYADWTVNELIASALPVSLTIGGLAILLSLIFGIVFGLVAAIRQNSWFDYIIMFIANIGSVIPSFVMGPFLILLLAIWIKWLPAGGWNDFQTKYIVLPVLLIFLINISTIARIMRACTLEILSSNFIRTAFAKGLPLKRIIFSHALKPAILPVVSVMGPLAVSSITSAIVTEFVFSLPGIGKLVVNAASNRDYTLVTGLVALITVVAVLFNFVVDIFYSFLDPKIRYSK